MPLKSHIKFCENVCLKTVLTGLHANIRTVVRARKPDDLCDVGKLILEEEKLLYLETARNQNANPRKANLDYNVPSQTANASSFKPKTDLVICSYCKKPNHHISDCRKRLFRNSQNKTTTHSYSTHDINPPRNNNYRNTGSHSTHDQRYSNQNYVNSNVQNRGYSYNYSGNFNQSRQKNNSNNQSNNFYRNSAYSRQSQVNHLNEFRGRGMGDSTLTNSQAQPAFLEM